MEALLVLVLLVSCAFSQEQQCDEEDAAEALVAPPATDAAVASVLNEIRQRASTAACTPLAVRRLRAPVVVDLGRVPGQRLVY